MYFIVQAVAFFPHISISPDFATSMYNFIELEEGQSNYKFRPYLIYCALLIKLFRGIKFDWRSKLAAWTKLSSIRSKGTVRLGNVTPPWALELAGFSKILVSGSQTVPSAGSVPLTK